MFLVPAFDAVTQRSVGSASSGPVWYRPETFEDAGGNTAAVTVVAKIVSFNLLRAELRLKKNSSSSESSRYHRADSSTATAREDDEAALTFAIPRLC